jgi:hypothetical protein
MTATYFVLRSPKGLLKHLAEVGPLGEGTRALCGRDLGINAAKVDIHGDPYVGQDDVCKRCVATSATRTVTVPRPQGEAADITGRLVDVETGEVLIKTRAPEPTTDREKGEESGWLLRWRTSHMRKTDHRVRLERYAVTEERA